MKNTNNKSHSAMPMMPQMMPAVAEDSRLPFFFADTPKQMPNVPVTSGKIKNEQMPKIIEARALPCAGGVYIAGF